MIEIGILRWNSYLLRRPRSIIPIISSGRGAENDVSVEAGLCCLVSTQTEEATNTASKKQCQHSYVHQEAVWLVLLARGWGE